MNAYRIILLSFFALLFVAIPNIHAQNRSIRGRLVDDANGKSLSGLTVLLNGEPKGVQSNIDGAFLVSNLNDTVYELNILIKGLSLKKIELKLSKQRTNLGIIKIDHALLIADSLAPYTTYSNEMLKTVAAAFPVSPNSVLSELIVRIPSIMRVDGKLYVQGQLLQELMIDGNIFFVSNDEAVLRNFSSEFVDTLTIFDDVSDSKTATGFDDNQLYKSIDLKPKKEYENSLFGQAYAGLGSKERWNMGANVNYFKGNRKFTLIQQINNINLTTFTPYDFDDVTGTNNLTAFTDRASSNAKASFYQFVNSISDFTIDQSNGINSSSSFGLSYFDDYSKGHFYGNYFYNQTDNITNGNISRQYFSNNTYHETINSVSSNTNHRFRTKLYHYFNDYNLLKVSPRFYMQKTTGVYNADGEFVDSLSHTSKAFSRNIVDMSAYNISAAINYLRTFRKEHRTFTIDVTPSYTQTKGNWSLESNIHMNDIFDTLNTNTDYNKSETTVTGEMLYTEPITTNGTLLAGYLLNYTDGNLKKETNLNQYGWDLQESLPYNLSNDGTTLYMTNDLKLMYQYRGNKWRINPGLVYQYATSTVKIPVLSIQERSYHDIDWLPMVYFIYDFSRKSNMKLSYTTSTSSPTTEQLLNLVDMTNPLNLSEGNPDLTQSKSSTIEFRYTYMFDNNLSNMYMYLGAIKTSDYIATQNYTRNFSADSFTVAISRPVNMDDYANAFGFINYNTRFKSIAANFGVNLHYKFYHIPSMNEMQPYIANQNMLGVGASLNSALREWFTFYVATNTDYNYISNTLNTNISKYLRQNTSLKVDCWILKDLLFSTDLVHRFNYGLADGFEDSYFVWNAFVGYRFLKDKNLECRLSIHDILNTNQNIQQSITDYYVEDIRTNNLQRYVMVSVIYNLNMTNLNH